MRKRRNKSEVSGVRILSKKEKQQQEYYSLLKLLVCCICILIMVFVLNWIVTSNITFNGIYYEEPEENEIIEVISGSEDGESSERVNLHLNGKLSIELTVGDKYVEPGFIATSDLHGDISDYVIVSGNVDTETVGTYQLKYTLSYRGVSPKLTRIVKVEPKPISDEITKKPEIEKDSSSSDSNKGSSGSSNTNVAPNNGSNNSGSSNSNSNNNTQPVKPQGNITLRLNGDATIYLVEGGSYKESGATAIDNSGTNVSSKINISGSVNSDVAGTYKITYSIRNYNGETLSVVRNVIVQSMGVSLKLDNSLPTNKSVNIMVNTDVDNFSRLMLPNGTKVPNKIYTYNVSANGTYEFVVFNTAGNSRKATIVVKNIDKDKPKGKCYITQLDDFSQINIEASDYSGIERYIYSGKEYGEKNIKLSRKLASGVQINVGFYDRAGNYGTANCLVP